jgi:phage baseplate assembly protein W
MFLERKFLTVHVRDAQLGGALANPVADRVRDVIHNLERVLAAERGISHRLPDYGLSRSGAWSAEGVLAHAAAELRETLPRYEPRLAIDDLDTDLDDDGRPVVHVIGRIKDSRVVISIDPLRRRVTGVTLR